MDRVVDLMVDEHSFSASSTQSKDLPRDRFISRVDYLAKVVYDTGSAVTENEDALLRMLGGLRIEGSKNITPADISDLRLLFYYNWLTMQNAPQIDSFDDTTSQADLTKRVRLPLHFGVDPSNPFDPSAGIPAERGISELKSKWVWPAATAGGTGVTTDVLSRVGGAVFGLQGGPAVFAKPKFVESDYSPGVQTNLGYKVDLPTGAFLKRTLIMMLDSSGNRVDTYITDIAVEVPKLQNTKPLKLDWYTLKALSAVGPVAAGNTPAEGIPAGIAMIDWSKLIDPSKLGAIDPRALQYGFDMRNAEVGDVKLSFTIATASGTLKLLHHQFEVN